MPLYEYHCETCARDFEKRRSIAQADEPTRCPECASDEVTRKLSLFIALTKNDSATPWGGGGCACGGACSCSGHSSN